MIFCNVGLFLSVIETAFRNRIDIKVHLSIYVFMYVQATFEL